MPVTGVHVNHGLSASQRRVALQKKQKTEAAIKAAYQAASPAGAGGVDQSGDGNISSGATAGAGGGGTGGSGFSAVG
jgi:hypothetical protein